MTGFAVTLAHFDDIALAKRQSVHWVRTRLCSHMPPPPQSLHLLRTRRRLEIREIHRDYGADLLFTKKNKRC
jgi:hypothetical protein